MRQVTLDVETTGLNAEQGDRMIEIGCVEIKNRRITKKYFHYYLNPEREIEKGALEVHGISNDFLKDKPKFADIAEALCEFVKNSEVIIHNAPFDVGFIDNELQLFRSDLGKLSDYCKVFDTLTLARQLHPGQRNSLDALCKRYNVNSSNRSLHGGLLDAELLARVYLAMTGGQSVLFSETQAVVKKKAELTDDVKEVMAERAPLKVIKADDDEQILHEKFLKIIEESSDGQCVWTEES